MSHIVLPGDGLTLCGISAHLTKLEERCAPCGREFVWLAVRRLTGTTGNVVGAHPVARRPWEMA